MKKISSSERSIMVYLWTEEEAGRGGKGFGEIFHVMGEGIAKQTVNTFIRRLVNKGFLTHEGKEGRRVYYSCMSRADYALSLLQDIYPEMSEEKEEVLWTALETLKGEPAGDSMELE